MPRPSTLTSILAATIAAGAVLALAGPADAATTPGRVAKICSGGETNSAERDVDTLLVTLDIRRGTVRGYWVRYGDELVAGPEIPTFDAVPVYVALPPDAAQNPGKYVYRLDYREYYTIGTTEPATTADPAQVDVLTYRNTPDWMITPGGVVQIDGRIFGTRGTFSTCMFRWEF